jgi:putative peptidoglycan lipid II flippase
VNIAGSAALFVLLRRRLGRLDLRGSASAFVRIVVASAVAGAVAYGVWRGLDEALGRSLGGQIVSVGTALLAATAAYGLVCRALGVDELRALLSLRRRSE